MDLTSRSRRTFSELRGGAAGGADRISALPDDLLLLILARLGCAATAARAGVLARRWRDLWTRLPVLAFRGVSFGSLEPALARVSSVVPLLEIHVPDDHLWLDSEDEPRSYSHGVNRLLRAAERLAPENFVFALPLGSILSPIFAEMPRLHRATSIVLESLQFLCLHPPTGVEFPELKLSLSGCVVDVNTLLSRCPGIRVLSFKDGTSSLFNIKDDHHLKVHSASLQELVADTQKEWTGHVDIVAPLLKQLTISFRSPSELIISILAPMLEKVSWHCNYDTGAIGFGLWALERLWLHTAEKQGKLIPSLHIHARNNFANFSGEAPNFRKEIEKHMVVDFSVLELHLTTMGHVFGAFVLHLLEMNRIRSATRRLRVVLPSSEEKDACPIHCPCEPTNWKTHIFSLTALEEVEIDGLQGEDHEFDFLKLILECAPMLKTIIVKLSHEVSSSKDGCSKMFTIFGAYPSVKCCVYLSSGLLHGSQNCPST